MKGYPNMQQKYSVLMSVYCQEKPEYFRQAIDSMLNQTVLTNDFVIVCDGPLTVELDKVIDDFTEKQPDLFSIIRLENNQGLGNALNAGLKNCKNEIVARMDSDDISLPTRCEEQLSMFERDADLAFCSGTIAEFSEDIEHINGLRTLPLSHPEILKFSKTRCPMNHMAVMYKKSAVEDAGSYIEIPRAEDYYLWVRMLMKGYKASNTEKTLVYARIGNGMYKRRGGLEYAKSIIKTQKLFYQNGFITKTEFFKNCFIRISVSLCPNQIRGFVYRNILRTPAGTH